MPRAGIKHFSAWLLMITWHCLDINNQEKVEIGYKFKPSNHKQAFQLTVASLVINPHCHENNNIKIFHLIKINQEKHLEQPSL